MIFFNRDVDLKKVNDDFNYKVVKPMLINQGKTLLIPKIIYIKKLIYNDRVSEEGFIHYKIQSQLNRYMNIKMYTTKIKREDALVFHSVNRNYARFFIDRDIPYVETLRMKDKPDINLYSEYDIEGHIEGLRGLKDDVDDYEEYIEVLKNYSKYINGEDVKVIIDVKNVI